MSWTCVWEVTWRHACWASLRLESLTFSPPASVLPTACRVCNRSALISKGRALFFKLQQPADVVAGQDGARSKLSWGFYGADFSSRRRSSRLDLNKCRQNLLLRSKVMPKTEECVWEEDYSNATCTHGARQLPRITIDLFLLYRDQKFCTRCDLWPPTTIFPDSKAWLSCVNFKRRIRA